LQSNLRTDNYSIDQSIELIHTIVSSIRREVPKEFILSIKLSAADYGTSDSPTQAFLSEDESRALEHILAMAQWGGVDIIEISGGDYEKPGNLIQTLRNWMLTH
jgi:2,4-dienoyl-CoA reductase-like NADH-dependent reductase (Old Yellow Enzyme family)